MCTVSQKRNRFFVSFKLLLKSKTHNQKCSVGNTILLDTCF